MMGHEINISNARSELLVYPELGNPVTLTKASGAWAAYPTPTEIIPVNTITSDFDICSVSVNTISDAGDYTLALYKGLVGSEVKLCSIPISRTATASQEGSLLTGIIKLPMNTRISAAISGSNAAQNTLTTKIQYHRY